MFEMLRDEVKDLSGLEMMYQYIQQEFTDALEMSKLALEDEARKPPPVYVFSVDHLE